MHLRAYGIIPQLVRQLILINLIELRLLARFAHQVRTNIYYKIVYVLIKSECT